MTYEIRIRQRETGFISQDTYEVSEETGQKIVDICERAVSRKPTDATPIEFGCHDGVCEIPQEEPTEADKLVGRMLP